jgi:hypothetical protein
VGELRRRGRWKGRNIRRGCAERSEEEIGAMTYPALIANDGVNERRR